MSLEDLTDSIKQYPSLEKLTSDMMEFAEDCVRRALRTQRNGGVRLFMDDECELYRTRYGETLDQDLFISMLSERGEFAEVEDDLGKLLIEIDDAYQSADPYEISQKELEIMLANHTLWRHNLGGEQADFSNCILRGLRMVGMNLSQCECENARFENCDMRYLNIDHSNLMYSMVSGCDMRGMCARHASFYDAEFWNCDFEGAVLRESSLVDVEMYDCDIDKADLSDCCLKNFSQIDNSELESETGAMVM